jgi:hypothetical protein
MQFQDATADVGHAWAQIHYSRERGVTKRQHD